MRVFVTGATGFIGTALVADLIAHGHQVLGLARSPRAAEKLRKAGAEPHAGSLRDLESLRRGAAVADAVAHLAFTFSPLDMPVRRTLRVFLGGPPTHLVRRMMTAIGATDRVGIDALGAALEGSGRALVTTFGVMGLAGAPGERAAVAAQETDGPTPGRQVMVERRTRPRSSGGRSVACAPASCAWRPRCTATVTRGSFR